MIRYTTDIEGISAADLTGFFEGWLRHPSPETHLEILQAADAVVLAIDTEADDRIIGFAYAITDGILAGYIPLLEVLTDYRERGIGSEVIKTLVGELEHLYMIDAVCDPEVESFYKPLGFSPLSGMALRNYERQTGTDA